MNQIKTEEVTAVVAITGSAKYGSRDKDEKFTIESRDRPELERLGVIAKAPATGKAD